MLFLLSPAKSLDFSPPPVETAATTPELAADAALLAAAARRLKKGDLKRLMSISDKLAELNVARFQALDLAREELGLPAVLAFDGEVYSGLDARSLSGADLSWAQDHVRILSGLYGVLRPLDRIQPYRLEMGTRLKTRRGEDLYDFWGDRLAKALNRAVADHREPVVVNVASAEYADAVDRRALRPPMLTVRFLEEKDGQARVLSFFAKKARGSFVRWAIQNRVERTEDLRAFDAAGYRLRPDLSDDAAWTWSRPQPPAPGVLAGARSAGETSPAAL